MDADKSVRRRNMAKAIAVASILEPCFGPRGLDKMLVNLGETEGDKLVFSNDGKRIIELVSAKNKFVELFTDVAKSQCLQSGNGTKTAVILAGYLLVNALKLLDMGLKPSTIISGYQIAYEKALSIVDKIAVKASPDEVVLRKIALTAMRGKGVGMDESGELLADLVTESVLCVTKELYGRRRVEIDNIKVEAYSSGFIDDSRLIKGIVTKPAYGCEELNPNVPRRMEEARIALLYCPLEVRKTALKHELEVNIPQRLRRLYEWEVNSVKEMVNKMRDVGANVVLNGRRVDPLPQYYFGKAGIMLVRNVSESDMRRIADATGGKIIKFWRDVRQDDLGWAKTVEWRKLTPGGEWRLFIEGCRDPRATTLLILGSSVHVKDAIHNAINATAAVVEDGRYIGGGGAFELELASKLRRLAKGVGQRERLAIEAFADALEEIPKVIAKNAGMRWLDVLLELRSKHVRGERWCGVDAIDPRIVNVREAGILDPLRIKINALSSGVEMANLVLRVDREARAK